jgi:hypothetical protein
LLTHCIGRIIASMLYRPYSHCIEALLLPRVEETCHKSLPLLDVFSVVYLSKKGLFMGRSFYKPNIGKLNVRFENIGKYSGAKKNMSKPFVLCKID